MGFEPLIWAQASMGNLLGDPGSSLAALLPRSPLPTDRSFLHFSLMAARKTLKSINPALLRSFVSSYKPRFLSASALPSSADEAEKKSDESIFIKGPPKSKDGDGSSSSSVTMPMSFMTGSIVGKRFYKSVYTREADDGNGWTVLLDYRTLKTPSKRPLKLPTLALAKAISAEWEYQQTDGIRPFTMPLMKLACTALERVPLTRNKIIENLMKKVHQDLIFCRSPGDSELTGGVLGVDKQNGIVTNARPSPCGKPCFPNQTQGFFLVPTKQKEKMDPFLNWVESEFGHKPVVYSSFFGGKQEEGLVNAVESVLKNTNDCELAAIDAMAAAAHSLIISIAIFRGRLQIEEAIELIRLEEDLQVDQWGLVEGGHDVDIADLKVQISSATVFLGLSRR
ncbi:hypothetical protein ACLOJK_024789 [Asimina triloba]